MDIKSFLNKQSENNLLLISVITSLIIGILDYLTGEEISVVLFYIIPVLFSSWYLNRRAAFQIAALCSVLWFIFDVIGRKYPYTHPFIPFWNTLTRFGTFILIILLITRIKTLLERESKIARTDFLTGSLNSRAFFEYANLELSRTKRNKRPITIVYLDADNFKEVNDTFGHSAGDDLLKSCVGIIKKNIRNYDLVGRLGGDEFAILLPETGPTAAIIACRKIQDSLTEEMIKKNLPVTFSIGLVTYVKPPESVNEMLKKADALMYEVKTHGKSSFIHEIHPR